MTIKELIEKTNFNNVVEQIQRHYGDKELIQFESLYNRLKEMKPNENIDEATLFIRVYIETDEESILTYNFDENNSGLNFDVSLKQSSDDMLLSISSSSYSDFLSYNVEDETMNKLSCASILAHSLWEITAYTFDKSL